MICYDKMIKMFEQQKITSYSIKKDKVIGQASWKKIHEGGHIDTRTLDALCKYLNCQPGDLLEYVPDDTTGGIKTLKIENDSGKQ